MNSEEKNELLMNLQRFSSHRAIEIANGNLEKLNLLLESSVKSTQIRGLIAQNLQYTAENNQNLRYSSSY
ncbi:hypothetical protein TVAG_013810 [Trichomonas vaginalis G3]|uniref:Uncharacterized protein n=1 Tax=Trichomonas vaginalis (strain ATCC PRA-98 / G3) TaxID=412133 RepID=A2DDD6_TRIV3|nr:hypothetical protein TVAGG3_0986510 [Trichomonas vaginalis G3]EAY21615.1 hypothetical protein TVAG_013810 [Trichomonas vaginalis G3]KAI5489709.1 hypothetical protein TVAGG3_0986510 [Trichomonas vaginalis G3]|eukprot:XP_001582601.1 hypothetical protein [Trichomonas vaginalis G3]